MMTDTRDKYKSVIDLTKIKQVGDLCINLNTQRREKDKHVFLFVSNTTKEGATTIAVNIAHMLTRSERTCKTLLIDANFLNPQLHNIFNLSHKPGLKQVLLQESKVVDAIQQTCAKNLYVMTTGNDIDNLSPDFNVEYLNKMIQALKDHFEYILIDGINNAPEHAKKLLTIARRIPCKVNLIAFNEFPESPFKRPQDEQNEAFQKILIDGYVTAFLRKSKGTDILAACGQLSSK